MRAGRRPTAHALLARHFLTQFLENDLVSPDADRSQLMAMTGAALLSLTLFASALMSLTYIGAFLTPGQVAVLALNDKFFYLSLSMLVTALVAAGQWESLGVNGRDVAILAPLPVPVEVIRRAKLSAVAMLGGGAALGVTVCPTLVFPSLVVFNFRQMRLGAMVTIMAVHAVVTVAAACFGYVAILAVREGLMALLGGRRFARVSLWVQTALIVVLGGMLLLLPAASRGVARGMDGWRAMAPPTWFLGAYELAAGGLIADLSRPPMTARLAAADRAATAVYEQRRPRFAGLAARAAVASAITLLLAAAAYAWNGRRMPSLADTPVAARRRGRMRWPRLIHRWRVGSPTMRAGYGFAVAAMWRSSAHRLTLAVAIAIGVAMAVVALSRTEWPPEHSAGFYAIQPLLYGALLVGFRHAIRVPAELRANWSVQLAWRGHTAAFLLGVRCAALARLVLPALAVVGILDVLVLGARPALAHAALGLAGAIVMIEALLLGYDKVPFTCSYVPRDQTKLQAPVYLILFVAGAALFARWQYAAVTSGGSGRLLALLAGAWLALGAAAVMKRRDSPVVFDEAPATLQRLGLDG